MIERAPQKIERRPLLLTQSDHLLKNGDLLGLWDPALNINREKVPFHGLYWKGMRYLSKWNIMIGHSEIFPLNSVKTSEFNRTISPYYDHVRLLGPSLNNFFQSETGNILDFDGPLLIERARFCGPHWMIEEISIHNHAPSELKIPFIIHLESDFNDILDIRGIRTRTTESSALIKSHSINNEFFITYEGLDKIERKTSIFVNGPLLEWNDGCLHTHLSLPPHRPQFFRITVFCNESSIPTIFPSQKTWTKIKCIKIRSSLKKDALAKKKFRTQWPIIKGDGLPLSMWADNAIEDLRVLLSRTKQGIFPYAGIPWFSTPFGRDALITGFSTVWALPSLSKSILLFLAAKQAKNKDAFRDAEPGKILHEFRYGEAGKDSSVPFGLYYGSVDSTPLFIALCWTYFTRTLDGDLLLKLKPVLIKAMEWIEKYGIHPDTGFLVYSRDPQKGLTQKGWKDSGDSIFHSNGKLAEHPIALAEVQGYLYMAYKGFSEIMNYYKDTSMSRIFEKKALTLKNRFNNKFWSDKINMYSLAIDGKNNPCEVRTSNAGHLLISGIAEYAYAKKTAEELLKPDLHTGWGVRTLSSNEIRYNPVSYHNGSVWPHDNAMIMAGLAKYGLNKELSILAQSYFDTLKMLPLERPPELFCGFSKENSEGPLSYPTSCRIQSWSVASFFLVIQSISNLGFDGKPTEHFKNTSLPISLNSLTINNIYDSTPEISLKNTEINRITGHSIKILSIENLSQNDQNT